MSAGNETAFPLNAADYGYEPAHGLTKREYYAAGFGPQIAFSLSEGTIETVAARVAKAAFIFADAMIAEGEKS